MNYYSVALKQMSTLESFTVYIILRMHNEGEMVLI